MGVSAACKIGLTSGGLATLTSLGISAPVATYQESSDRVVTGDGATVRRGWATAEWYWPFLSQTEIDLLRDYCPGASAPIYITTPINDGRAYDDFSATVVWPEDEKGTKFTLRFVKLVAV